MGGLKKLDRFRSFLSNSLATALECLANCVVSSGECSIPYCRTRHLAMDCKGVILPRSESAKIDRENLNYEKIPNMKILPRSESGEIGGGNPNYEKIPNMKILPRSESAEIGGGYPNCEKIPTTKMLPRSESAEIGGGNANCENSNCENTPPI